MIPDRTQLKRRSVLTSAAAMVLATPALAQNRRADTLRFVPQANLAILDPIWTTIGVTTEHAHYVFDMLYAIDGKLQPRPQMAEGHTVSEDGRTWQIRLRDGLKFHDGTPVRAADCAASIRRWVRATVSARFCLPSPTRSMPSPIAPSVSG